MISWHAGESLTAAVSRTQKECLYYSAPKSLNDRTFPAPSQSHGMTVIYTDCHVAVYLAMHYTFITLHLGEALSFPVCHPSPHLHVSLYHLSSASPSTPGRQGPSALSPQKARQAWCCTGYPERPVLLSSLETISFRGFRQQTPHFRGSHTDVTSHGCRLSGSRLLKSQCWARDACWLVARYSSSALWQWRGKWDSLGCAFYQDNGPTRGALGWSLPKGSTF